MSINKSISRHWQHCLSLVNTAYRAGFAYIVSKIMLNVKNIDKLFNFTQAVKLCRSYSLHNVRPTGQAIRSALGEKELERIERNILLRRHKNNVPIIRSLLAQLSNTPTDSNVQDELSYQLSQLPNDTHPRILHYGDNPRELLHYTTSKVWNNVKEFSEMCKRLNLLRMDNLGNYTGHKSYYLMGGLALLEQAIVRYALDSLKQKNFLCISVPDILPKSIIEGCGMKTDGERTQVYKLNTGECLSGTSEMALAGFYKDKVLNEKDLPLKVTAVSRCYRAETSGLHEEKGIYRVHQFTKVEMFALCTEADSEKVLESFKDTEISLFQNLDIDFRVLDMPPSELGATAYQKYDIEAWMPARKMWGEISSCSNCTDYQSKRLNIRYLTEDKQLKYVHTINGTAAAVPRLLISLIETCQEGTDTIVVPNILEKYFKAKKITKDKRMPEVKLVKFIK